MPTKIQNISDEVPALDEDLAARHELTAQLSEILSQLDLHKGAEIAAIHVHHAINAIEEMDKSDQVNSNS